MGVVDGKIYVVGGRASLDFSRNLVQNEEYDPTTDIWIERTPLPTARSGMASATVDGRLYVVGGEGSQGTFDDNEAYDPATDSWETLSQLPTARHGMGAATVDGTMYVPAGGPTAGFSVTGANEAFTP